MRRRHQARRIALQTLFQADVGGIPIEEAIATTLEDSRLPADVADFARTLVEGTWRHRDELDRFIQEHAPHWPLERMANVDRNILRMAVYEILYLHDIPYSVSINEAVELAKLFGSTESGRFVNGVLGSFVRRQNVKREGKESEV